MIKNVYYRIIQTIPLKGHALNNMSFPVAAQHNRWLSKRASSYHQERQLIPKGPVQHQFLSRPDSDISGYEHRNSPVMFPSYIQTPSPIINSDMAYLAILAPGSISRRSKVFTLVPIAMSCADLV